MNPYGGQEGYQAAFPSEEDPTKTNNVAEKLQPSTSLVEPETYFLGVSSRKVRPDVSKDEYMRYKAFKFDKDGDMNPLDDGQMTIPTGVAKVQQRRYPRS